MSRKLTPPEKGNLITWDEVVPAFGARVTAAGHRAFVLNYTLASGRERRYTIGGFPGWSTTAAPDEAQRLKASIRANNEDPVGSLEHERGAPTVEGLADRYIKEHLPRKRPKSQADDRYMIERSILPALRHVKVADVDYDAIDRLHRKISKETPIRANRVVSLLSKMFSLSIRWRWRTTIRWPVLHGIRKGGAPAT